MMVSTTSMFPLCGWRFRTLQLSLLLPKLQSLWGSHWGTASERHPPLMSEHPPCLNPPLTLILLRPSEQRRQMRRLEGNAAIPTNLLILMPPLNWQRFKLLMLIAWASFVRENPKALRILWRWKPTHLSDPKDVAVFWGLKSDILLNSISASLVVQLSEWAILMQLSTSLFHLLSQVCYEIWSMKSKGHVVYKEEKVRLGRSRF